MKQAELSKWLRAIVVVAALCFLALCVFIIPNLGRDAADMYPEFERLLWPCLIFFWVTALPVFAALGCAWMIFVEIGRDNSFCPENAKRLRNISGLAILDTVLYIIFAIVLAVVGVLHPSVLLAVLAVVFVGLSMAVATAALSHLTRKAASLKDENDLTI